MSLALEILGAALLITLLVLAGGVIYSGRRRVKERDES
ncbi:hypothetical protein Daudx_1510 [Candidatus Desulforudis audaxviator]|nr:hypothetical protein Daudx_1510 [Candidatus Desulforudis audaxviator]